MDKLVFNAVVKSVYSEVPRSQLLAIQGDEEITHEQPVFGVRLMLSSIFKRNKNGNRLLLPEVKKAIAAMGDRPYKPGNFNHETAPMATSTKFWIENEDTNPELWLEGVVWNRCLTEDAFGDTIQAFRNGTLGASFEIDKYRLQAADDIDDTEDVYDHTLDGWALTVGCEPADQATKGRVSITATSDNRDSGQDKSDVTPQPKEVELEPILDAKDNMIHVWTSDMALGFLNSLPCPECDARYCSLKKADFENAVFEMECDDEHRFEVKITVKSKGAEATVVGGNVSDSKIELGYKVTPSKEVDDLSKEYTDEQIDEIIVKAKADSIAEQEVEAKEAAKREVDLKAEVDKVKVEAEKDKTDAVEQAKKDAVEEYKKSQEAVAKRIDELHEILPYESEEAKIEAKPKVGVMSDDEYEVHKGAREKDKEIADLTVQLAAANGTPIIAKVKLPVGEITGNGSKQSVRSSFDALQSV